MHKPEFRFGFGLSYGKSAISADADSPQDIGTADGEAQQRRERELRELYTALEEPWTSSLGKRESERQGSIEGGERGRGPRR